MERFFNAIKAQSAAMDRATGQPRFAVVTSVDPARPAARVALQPEGVITGWLPILSHWVGAGWGMACPPSPGDQVLVLAQEGDAEHGVIIGRAWSDQARPPQAPAGELWLVHATGAFIKLTADGTIRLQGDVHLSGSLYATGDVSDGHGPLSGLRAHYNAHIHPTPKGNSGTTTEPD